MLVVMLCNRPDDVRTDWVFGYGSLIWNPEFEFERAELARAHGYHRAFCVRSTLYRGTPQHPGLVLGLDRGGSCVGVAYRLAEGSRIQAIEALFAREIPDPRTSIYLARVVAVRLGDGQLVSALAFVADRSRSTYQRLDDAEILERLRYCTGLRGPNREYAINTMHALRERGVDDPHLGRLVAHLLDHERMDAGPLQPDLPAAQAAVRKREPAGTPAIRNSI